MVEQFIKGVKNTRIKQIIYLGGIINDEKKLSPHLKSRLLVEQALKKSGIPYTVLRASIIIGAGSASFEIIRDLVEKLPVMITPKWLNTKHQPIAIRNILEYLTGVLLKPATFNKSYDVGGPDVLSYKEMLLQLAEVRGLKRFIFTVPVMTPRLSSYWLNFVTSTSYMLAINLVMRHGEAVAIGTALETRIARRLGICHPAAARRIAGLLSRLGLPSRPPSRWSRSAFQSALALGKKATNLSPRWVLPSGIGRCVIGLQVAPSLIQDVMTGAR